jgi:pimeloyl-ACP methyl ester carboxylesterase
MTTWRWSIEHDMVVRRSGTGPELVWIHGLGEWSVTFEPIVQHPAFTRFTHVLPDLPGYGRSAWPERQNGGDRDSLEALADRLETWLSDRPPAILLGHSMGGVLAVLIAERLRVRGVVNIDGNLSRGDCTFSAEAAAYGHDDFLARGMDEMRDRVYARGNAEPPLRGYHAAMCAASPAVFHRNATDLVASSVTERMPERMAALECPKLFVAGVPAGICEHSRGLLDRHEIPWVGVEPAGHWVFVDQPDRFADAVAHFIEQADRR